jgi:hypothetical protein
MGRDQSSGVVVMFDDIRGQVMTLGAVVAAVLLMTGLLYAISVSPSSGERDVVEQLNNKQNEERVSDFVAVADKTGALKHAILSWNDGVSNWVGTPGSGYHTRLPTSYELATPLDRIFATKGIAYNIEIEYTTSTGSTNIQRLVYQGTPGHHATVATTTYSLSDDTNLVGPSSGQTLKSASSYFAPDANPNSQRYNTVRVIIITWQV